METLHGHQVFNLLEEHAKDLTLSELQEVVRNRFGTEVCFYTCSEEGMSLEQIIQFFVSHGKISFDGTNISINDSCGH